MHYRCLVLAVQVPREGESHQDLNAWIKAYPELTKRIDCHGNLSCVVIDKYGVTEGKPGHYIYRVEHESWVRMWAASDSSISVNLT